MIWRQRLDDRIEAGHIEAKDDDARQDRQCAEHAHLRSLWLRPPSWAAARIIERGVKRELCALELSREERTAILGVSAR